MHTIDEWEWDDDNLNELARHGVTRRAVLETAGNAPRFRRNKRNRAASHQMIGPDDGGALWTVCLVEHPTVVGRWRAVTGWRSSDAEAQWYPEGTMSERDVEEVFEHRDDDGEWDDEPADVVVRTTRSEVVSFRLPSEEMDKLHAAANGAGESISEFVRKAVTQRIEGRAPHQSTADMHVGRATLRTSRRPSNQTDSAVPLTIVVPDYPPTGSSTTT